MDLEERMLRVERETAVQGQQAKTHRDELNELFTMFRKHMETEEEQRTETISLITNIDTKISNQKSFWGGMVFAGTVLGGFAALILNWVLKGGPNG